jgi:hypothetical protein
MTPPRAAGRRPASIALAVVAAVAAVAVLILLGRAGFASWGSTPSAVAGPASPVQASPAPRPTDSTWPLADQAPAPAPASASASASAKQTAPAASVSPAPFIQTFAAQPGVRPQPALTSPTATLAVKADVDGCDHAYGTKTQCVPATFPPGVTDKCAWLAAHGFVDLKVVGADDQHLDPDKNGIACD